MKLRSHSVAQAAYERVERRLTFASKEKYGALAHKLPAMVLQNGLAQATGFLLAKSKGSDTSEFMALLDDLAFVLSRSGESRGCESGVALHRLVVQSDTMATMRLTRRGLAASGWLKRYVQGLLNVDATGGSAEQERTP